MTVYDSNQGDGLWIVFKLAPDGSHLNTHSYNGSYARKPPARTYNKIGPAKMQWTRYQREGYTARCAEVSIQGGKPHIQWCDQDWMLKPEICKFRYAHDKVYYHEDGDTYTRRQHLTCQRTKGHDGLHSPKKDKKETTDA